MRKFNKTRVTTSVAIKAEPGTIMALLLVAPTNDADILLYDDVDSAHGTVLLQASALNGTSAFIDLSGLGGVKAGTGIYADITGTNAIAYVWFE